MALTKGKSPFYPGQPVPFELFVGRLSQINHILKRGAGQVAEGKPSAVFVQGEYGIGKSSVAGITQQIASEQYILHPIYASLGSATDINEVGQAILRGTISSIESDPTRGEKIKAFLSKYLGEQQLFGGLTIRFDRLKEDAPSVANGLLPFLTETFSRLTETGSKGIFLVLDEINGITADKKFSTMIKELIDSNALSVNPLPLFLMLCGVEARRHDMIAQHQPVERIFDVVHIDKMPDREVEEFFTKAFHSVSMEVQEDGLKILVEYSAGFPKIMHLIGDNAFWTDSDGVIDEHDAIIAVVDAADGVGKKYVDKQVLRELKSREYHSILKKIAMDGPNVMTFRRSEVSKKLSSTEKRKFDNLLQKLKRLHVIEGVEASRGEYRFTSQIVRLYIWLNSRRKGDSLE